MLLAQKLERDPIEYITELRRGPNPLPYAKIADRITSDTGLYVTQELARRWYLNGQRNSSAA
jgi:hypothetical protein